MLNSQLQFCCLLCQLICSARWGGYSVGIGTRPDNRPPRHPGAPFPTGSFQSITMQGHVHPEGWGQRFEPKGTASDMLHAGLKTHIPLFSA